MSCIWYHDTVYFKFQIMVKTQIYFETTVLEELKATAQELGVAYSQLVRKAVLSYLESLRKNEYKLKSNIDWVSDIVNASGDIGGDSKRVDEILYSQRKEQ
jgi:hypothetical protein